MELSGTSNPATESVAAVTVEMDEISTREFKKLRIDEPTCILMIPNLVLEKIFKNLGTSDRMKARDVCRRWYYVMNDSVGLKKHIGDNPYHGFYGHDSVTWRSLEIIETTGIENCTFGDITESLSSEMALPTFWNPDIVNTVGFLGKISHYYFTELTAPLRFLTSLTLHLVTFVNVDFGAQQMVKMNLKSLRIVFTHPVDDLSWIFSATAEDLAHNSLIKLLETSVFPRIQSFSIEFPYFKNKMSALYRGISIFSRRSQNSLKNLNYHSPYEWTDKIIQSIQVAQCTDISWGIVQFENIRLVRLETSDDMDNDDSRRNKQAMNKYWTSLLFGQTQLKSLEYYNPDETWDFPASIFSNNANSLTHVLLTINPNYFIDCQALESCHNLTALSLHGTGTPVPINPDGDLEGLAQASRFLNSAKLPASLETLNITTIAISTKELDEMFKMGHLPRLKSLCLLAISKNFDNCGVTLGMVCQLLKRPAILNIRFLLAFNNSNVIKGFEKCSMGLHDEDVAALQFILNLPGHTEKRLNYFKEHPEHLSFEYNRSATSIAVGLF